MQFSPHCLCSSTSHFPLAPPPRLLIDFKNSKWLTYFCILLCICYCFSHLIGLRLVTWLSLLYKFTRFSIYFLFLSDEGPMLETLDYTIRIGSTPTFLYFDLYQPYSSWPVQPCSSWSAEPCSSWPFQPCSSLSTSKNKLCIFTCAVHATFSCLTRRFTWARSNPKSAAFSKNSAAFSISTSTPFPEKYCVPALYSPMGWPENISKLDYTYWENKLW